MFSFNYHVGYYNEHMASFQGRTKIKGVKRPSWVWFLISLFVTLFMVRGVYGVWQKNQVSRENLEAMEDKLDELKERKDDLERKVEALQTDRGLEEAFRENLPVAKPGEKVIIVVSPEDEPQKEEESSGWSRFWPF